MVISDKNVLKAKKAVEKAYDGVCSVVEYQAVTDEESGITYHNEVTVGENIPCKLSFELNYPSEQTDTASEISQRAKLFVSPEINIKNGSKIIVRQFGKTAEYCCCGETAVYPTHREIRVSPFVKWA